MVPGGVRIRILARPTKIPAIGRRLAEGLPDAMQAISEAILAHVHENFRREQTPWEEPWPAHSPATLAIYARGGFVVRGRAGAVGGERLGLASGTLQQSLVANHGPLSATVQVGGPAAKYAAVFQFGNPANRLPNKSSPYYRLTRKGTRSGPFEPAPAPIPARPFIPIRQNGAPDLPEELLDEIREMVLLALNRAAEGGT